ncbi:MAG TPA: protein kinase [Gemmataceae bacterium]|jgi:regulation of enolase protein 1 (concanavalin A-like superfamily)
MNERSIFFEALDRDTPAERSAYLDAVCGGDGALRQRVEALLHSHEQAGNFLDKTAPERLAAEQAAGDQVEQTPQEPLLDDSAEPLSFLSPSDRSRALGRLGHYEVLEVLGRGGFATVVRAFDEVLQRVVAIKVLSSQMAVTSPARKRFLREARAAAAVRNDHVVQIYAVQEQPRPYLVMEYIPGQTLQQKLDATGPLERSEMVRLAVQIARGLAAAHAQGLIHRDIKPSNILLEQGSETKAKLTDFGLARAADDASLTQSGVIAGTPLYMAPEQAQGDPIDHRTDLFSLGSVFYVMLTGRPPFRAPTTMAVLKRVCEDMPRPIREIIPEAPPWLCDLIGKLHAKKPDKRFRTAQEVADLLAQPPVESGTKVEVLHAARPRRLKLFAAGVLLLAVGLTLGLNAKRLTTLAADILGRKSSGFAGGAKVEDPSAPPAQAPPAEPRPDLPIPGDRPPPNARSRDWGRRFDPDGDCTFNIQGGALTVNVPPMPHDLSIERGQNNAPRVLREVDGDFRLQVKVCGDIQPKAAGSVPGRLSCQAGGILLWSDERNYVRFERAALNRNGKITTYAAFESRANGRPSAAYQLGIPDQDTHLRLERHGNQLRAFVSADGELWRSLQNIGIDLPPKVQVGVAAVNAAQQPLQVRFEELRIDH